MVHVLGNSGYIDEVREICKKKKFWLIEDTCESLGVKNKSKYLELLETLEHIVFIFHII